MMFRRRCRPTVGATLFEAAKGLRMWWGIGFGGLLYIVLMIVLGLSCLRKGHWVMFILGIFVPLFWIIGAIIPPVRPQTV
jgi:hypothetical protein